MLVSNQVVDGSRMFVSTQILGLVIQPTVVMRLQSAFPTKASRTSNSLTVVFRVFIQARPLGLVTQPKLL